MGEFKGKDAIRFDKGELFAAIHDADIEYSGLKRADGSWEMTVRVKDRWDFHLQSYYKESIGKLVTKMLDAQARLPGLMTNNGFFIPNAGWLQPLYDSRQRLLGIVANNLAALSQVNGAIQNYNWVSENEERGTLGE